MCQESDWQTHRATCVADLAVAGLRDIEIPPAKTGCTRGGRGVTVWGLRPPMSEWEKVAPLGEGWVNTAVAEYRIPGRQDSVAAKPAKRKNLFTGFIPEMMPIGWPAHPNVATPCMMGATEGGREFISVFDVYGADAKDAMSRTDLTETEFLSLTYQLMRGLAFIHGRLVSHGDLFDRNVFIVRENERDYRAVIGDFGKSLTHYDARNTNWMEYDISAVIKWFGQTAPEASRDLVTAASAYSERKNVATHAYAGFLQRFLADPAFTERQYTWQAGGDKMSVRGYVDRAFGSPELATLMGSDTNIVVDSDKMFRALVACEVRPPMTTPTAAATAARFAETALAIVRQEPKSPDLWFAALELAAMCYYTPAFTATVSEAADFIKLAKCQAEYDGGVNGLKPTRHAVAGIDEVLLGHYMPALGCRLFAPAPHHLMSALYEGGEVPAPVALIGLLMCMDLPTRMVMPPSEVAMNARDMVKSGRGPPFLTERVRSSLSRAEGTPALNLATAAELEVVRAAIGLS